jgi:phosphatidate cytidylyltransferase
VAARRGRGEEEAAFFDQAGEGRSRRRGERPEPRGRGRGRGGGRGGGRGTGDGGGRGSRRGRGRRRRSDTSARVISALPAIAFAIVIVSAGGIVFALGLILLGFVCLHELYNLMERASPVRLAGFAALAGLILAAHFGGQFQMVLVLVAAFPLMLFLAVARRQRRDVAWGIAATVLGITWIGLAFSHAVLLRDLPHGGGLLLDVLIGTFIGDTCAYFGGRAWGRRPLAPLISPNKTLEGLLAGIVGGTFAFWLFAFSYQDWFPGTYALIIGFCVALAAPLGDLFESLIKRDLDVKDTGRFFGAHGGALDRLDAVFFSVVVAYYVALALL